MVSSLGEPVRRPECAKDMARRPAGQSIVLHAFLRSGNG